MIKLGAVLYTLRYSTFAMHCSATWRCFTSRLTHRWTRDPHAQYTHEEHAQLLEQQQRTEEHGAQRFTDSPRDNEDNVNQQPEQLLAVNAVVASVQQCRTLCNAIIICACWRRIIADQRHNACARVVTTTTGKQPPRRVARALSSFDRVFYYIARRSGQNARCFAAAKHQPLAIVCILHYTYKSRYVVCTYISICMYKCCYYNR